MPGGRPTKYKPEYCQRLLQSARRNESIARFCADIDIHTDTYYGWIKANPEFSGAHKKAMTIRQANFFDKTFDCAFKPEKNPANNGLVYLLAYNLGIDVKPREKEDNSGEQIADAINNFAETIGDKK